MLRTIAFFPIKLAAMAGFFYACGGWLIVPPSMILGAF